MGGIVSASAYRAPSARHPTRTAFVCAAFGERVRELRIEQGLTQERLGLMTGICRTYIVSVEKGQRNVSLGILAKLADGLGISLSELLDGIQVG